MVVLAALEYAKVDSKLYGLVALLKYFDCYTEVKRIKSYLQIFKYGSIVWDVVSVYLLNIFIDHCAALIFIGMTYGE